MTAPAPVDVRRAIDEHEWDAFVGSRPEASAYHAWRWRYVFERAFKHPTLYLEARQDGRVVGVLPLVLFRSWLFGRFAVSLPFVNYGGVLAEDDLVAEALAKAAHLEAEAARLRHVELRHVARRFGLPFRQHKVAMLMPLPATATAAWEGLDRKVRNQVRKAEKSDLVVEQGGAELLPEFYRVFAHNMRDLGTPVYSRRFFKEVCAQFGEAIRVFVVRHPTGTAAAGIAYRFRRRVETPWASSLARFRSMSPNNLLYWRIIEWAIAEGCEVLDFGRSTPDEGTYHFKAQWGAVPERLHWEYALVGRESIPDYSPKNPRYGQAIAVWKKLPVSVASFVGPHIVRSIP